MTSWLFGFLVYGLPEHFVRELADRDIHNRWEAVFLNFPIPLYGGRGKGSVRAFDVFVDCLRQGKRIVRGCLDSFFIQSKLRGQIFRFFFGGRGKRFVPAHVFGAAIRLQNLFGMAVSQGSPVSAWQFLCFWHNKNLLEQLKKEYFTKPAQKGIIKMQHLSYPFRVSYH